MKIKILIFTTSYHFIRPFKYKYFTGLKSTEFNYLVVPATSPPLDPVSKKKTLPKIDFPSPTIASLESSPVHAISIIFPIMALSNYLKILYVPVEFHIIKFPSESPLATLFPLLLNRTAVVFALC